MRRWSLRRHKRRAPKADTGNYQLDPGRSDSFPPDDYRSQELPQAMPFSVAPAPGAAPPNGYAAQAPTTTGPWPSVPGFAAQRGGQQAADREPFSDPTATNPSGLTPLPAAPAAGGAWPQTMEQFGLHLLTLAEQMRISLDELESDESDPDRLQKLYNVDHAVTRMRRASRDLRTLAGHAQEEMSGVDTSLLDVVRMALSAIERYTQVAIGRVTELAVIGYAADDVASLLAALLDNATRYSPGTASVSAHLAGAGSVLFRIEDTGIGLPATAAEELNAVLAGPVPELDEYSGKHTGFPVVHRIARKYNIEVRLAARPSPGSGTIAMVTVPPELLCEVPLEPLGRPEPVPTPATGISVLPSARRASPAEDQPKPMPRRERTPDAPMPRREAAPDLPALRWESPADSPLPERQAPSERAAQPDPAPPEHARNDARNDAENDVESDAEKTQSTEKIEKPQQSESPGAAMAPDDHDADTSESSAAPEPGGLPRRESVSLRGENGLRSRPEEPERSPEEESASRHSFADDLDAFSLGTQDSAGKGTSSS